MNEKTIKFAAALSNIYNYSVVCIKHNGEILYAYCKCYRYGGVWYIDERGIFDSPEKFFEDLAPEFIFIEYSEHREIEIVHLPKYGVNVYVEEYFNPYDACFPSCHDEVIDVYIKANDQKYNCAALLELTVGMAKKYDVDLSIAQKYLNEYEFIGECFDEPMKTYYFSGPAPEENPEADCCEISVEFPSETEDFEQAEVRISPVKIVKEVLYPYRWEQKALDLEEIRALFMVKHIQCELQNIRKGEKNGIINL